MKNVTAGKALENSLLKKVEPFDKLDIAYPHSEFPPLYVDRIIPLEKKHNLFLKSSFDLLLSSLLLLGLFSWLLPIMILLIKLDSKGPVFFLQKRNKKNGKLFTCIKFRTMIENEEADLLPATADDGRTTRVGKFLRRHHLDELPQLINVWIGDMSLIGPRPYMISDNERYQALIHDYPVRHRVKPGITGLAQSDGYVGPVETIGSMEERVSRDLHYIYHWSPFMDAKIAFRTLARMAGIK